MTEELASLEHDQWSKWLRWMLPLICDGSSLSPSAQEAVSRWERQKATPYSALSEDEKESDRREVQIRLEWYGKASASVVAASCARLVCEGCRQGDEIGEPSSSDRAPYMHLAPGDEEVYRGGSYLCRATSIRRKYGFASGPLPEAT